MSFEIERFLRKALGLSPSCLALVSVVMMQAAAPSDRKELLAAVTVPPFLKAGLSFASLSMVLGLMPLS